MPISSMFFTFYYYFPSISLIFLALKLNPTLDAAPSIQCSLGHVKHKRSIYMKLQAGKTYINEKLTTNTLITHTQKNHLSFLMTISSYIIWSMLK